MSETETIARNLGGELARHRKTQATLAKELGMSLYQLMIKLLQPIDGIKQIKP